MAKKKIRRKPFFERLAVKYPNMKFVRKTAKKDNKPKETKEA